MSTQPVHVINATRDSEKMRMRRERKFSMRERPSTDGQRKYVGDSQVLDVTFPTSYTAPMQALAFTVSLDHVPVDAMPRSGIKVENGIDGGALIWEVHDDDHVWTRTTVYFACNTIGPVTQKWLVV
jgi:hypothetical protein